MVRKKTNTKPMYTEAKIKQNKNKQKNNIRGSNFRTMIKEPSTIARRVFGQGSLDFSGGKKLQSIEE